MADRVELLDIWDKPLCGICLSHIACPNKMGLLPKTTHRQFEILPEHVEPLTAYLKSGKCLPAAHWLHESRERHKLKLKWDEAKTTYDEMYNRPDGWSIPKRDDNDSI